MFTVRGWLVFSGCGAPTTEAPPHDDRANTLIIGYTHQDESRESRGELFPMVDVLDAGTVYTTFGFEPFTPNNELRYKTFQVQDNFTWNRGSHAFTLGASAERYESENVFFPGSQSVYTYNSLADFYADADDRAAFRSIPKRAVQFIVGCTVLAVVLIVCEHVFGSVR